MAEAKSLLAAAGVSNLKVQAADPESGRRTRTWRWSRARCWPDVGITVDVDSQEGGTYWNSGKGDVGKNIDMFIVRFNGKHDPNFIMQWFVSQADRRVELAALEQSGVRRAVRAVGRRDSIRAKRRQDVVDAQQLMDKSARVRLADQRGQHARLSQLDAPGRRAGLDRLAVRRLRRHDLTLGTPLAAAHDVRERLAARRGDAALSRRAASSRPC